MKKTVLLLSAVGLFLASCSDKNEYTIKGKVPGEVSNNSVVYLEKLNADWKGRTKIDSAIVLDGSFRFEGIAADKPQFTFVTIEDGSSDEKPIVNLFIEPGSIEVDYSAVPTVKGTVSNDNFQALLAKGMTLAEGGRVTLADETDELSNELVSYVKGNKGSEIADFLLVKNSYRFGYDDLKELVPTILVENENTSALKKRFEALKATQPGLLYTDIKGQTPKGVDVALSDYVGKSEIILVDFWASWCPPCREDMPAVVKMYEKYKSKGFEIVGVSLDNEVNKWEAGIEKLNVTWPQVSDLKGWSSELSGAYGVASIPHTMLLDKDGKIIARGLNVEELEKKLDELLNGK